MGDTSASFSDGLSNLYKIITQTPHIPMTPPVLGPYRWDEPPDEWERVPGVHTTYGRGVTGRSYVYVSSRDPDDRVPSAVWEGLGEHRVMYDGEVLARFPFYPESMREPPDYPGWSEASNMARGYAWRVGEELEGQR